MLMKTFLILSVVLCSINSFAQIKLGASIGLQLTNMDIKKDLSFNPTSAKVNPALGIYAEYVFKNNLSITSELSFMPFSYNASQMEVTASNGDNLGEISKHKINYLQLPIAINYNFDLEKIKLKFGLGPVFNVKINDKLYLEQPYNGNTSNAKIANTSGVLNFTTGFYLNTGISFSDFSIMAHAQKSLTGIYKTAVPSDIKFNGYAVGLSLIYFFKN
jgi:hypothetical protein